MRPRPVIQEADTREPLAWQYCSLCDEMHDAAFPHDCTKGARWFWLVIATGCVVYVVLVVAGIKHWPHG